MINRAKQISRNNDKLTDVYIGIQNIDAAVQYYFENVIKPSVEYDDEIIRVPLKYASAERWRDIRKSGFVRDRNGQIILPLIVYKRTSITKNSNMSTTKIDAQNPQIYRTISKQYTHKNRYSQFNKLIGEKPIQALHNIIIPNYIILSYDFTIWTAFVEHINTIIEAINYHEGSYWGNKQFKFISEITDYTLETESSAKEERFVRATFSLTLKGYLIPNIYNKVLQNQYAYTIKKLLINESVGIVPDEIRDDTINRIITKTSGSGGSNISLSLLKEMFKYLSLNTTAIGTPITNNTVLFTNVSIITPPSGYTVEVSDDFKYHINGILVQPEAIISLTVSDDSNLTLVIDTNQLGYTLDSEDEISITGPIIIT